MVSSGCALEYEGAVPIRRFVDDQCFLSAVVRQECDDRPRDPVAVAVQNGAAQSGRPFAEKDVEFDVAALDLKLLAEDIARAETDSGKIRSCRYRDVCNMKQPGFHR